MLDRVKELLKHYGISKNQPIPITIGASGAYVYDIDNKYIAKYAQKTEDNSKTYNMFVKEYYFLQMLNGKCYEFLPTVVFQTINQNEILIVMQKYAAIKPNSWDNRLMNEAMRLCARINSINIEDHALIIHDADYGSDSDTYPLQVSLENWLLLQRRFPDHIDAQLIKTMYENFTSIKLSAEQLAIPKTLCHGDFHPENFLFNGDTLVICDWQNVNKGKGISDVAFFISRGIDMGMTINTNMLIEEYHKAMLEITNKEIELSDLHRSLAASDFYVAFKFWAEYLQSSDINRVLNIYNSMVNSYMKLM